MWRDLIATFKSYKAAIIRPYLGGLRLLRPFVVERDRDDYFDSLKANNPAIELSPKREQDRILGVVGERIETQRRLAAAWSRHQARVVRPFVEQAREHIARTRRDTSLSFPDTLNGLDANGMVMVALLRAQTVPLVTAMSPARLFDTYQEAHRRKDARGFVEAQIIEDLVHSGAALSASQNDLPMVKRLREYVDGIEGLRLPADLPDFDSLLEVVDRLDSRADAIRLLPQNTPEAEAAFSELEPALTAAGEKSDAADQADVFDEIRRAS